ncbi:MAG TPA: glycosyl hydrolase family 28 protein [Verrucomicrobiae bacterium]|nr:glycosyl hydrolase family 28 protein [Verrucomicrobiae bacterium]
MSHPLRTKQDVVPSRRRSWWWVCVGAATYIMLVMKASAIVPWSLFINTNNIVVVTNISYGAVGDGVTINTTAIQNAINTATAGLITNGLIGGTVEIPPGVFLCGPLTLKKNVNLQIDAGAILRMLSYSQYPGGIVNPADFISGSSLTNIEISGFGAIDGQGAPWWPGYKTNARPSMISLSGCNREMIRDVTLSNSPMFHIAIGGNGKNNTVQGVTVRAPSSSDPTNPSHNTDACDVSGTNTLVQNCNISTGDDDFTCGGGTHDVLLTNNVYGLGHGISIGSYTDSGGVSNIMVINCTINGADNGIRIKSDNNRGGLVQNISYINIGITNVNFPIQMYSYYNEIGTPSSVTPTTAATEPVPAITNTLTPVYRNITFSNITATSVSGYPVGILWARTEMPATNIVFNKVNLTGDRNFCLYNINGAQFIDCNFKVSSGTTAFALFNSQAVISNSVPTNTLFTFDGLTTNGYGNTLAFYNALGSLKNTNVLDDGPLRLAASTLTVSNSLTLFTNTVLNFTLNTNTTKLAVVGNLALGGTNNISAGAGFTNGSYTLLTYTGTLSGSGPQLGSVPAGYNYAIDTGTVGQVNLLVTVPTPPAPTNLVAAAANLLINLKWNAVGGAASYNVKRGTANSGPYPTVFSVTATNYADAAVSNAVNYFYVVTALSTGGESTNSAQVGGIPLPSNQPTNILAQMAGNQLQLSWPQDHLGWRLQIQTNDLSGGLGTNWATVPNSTNVVGTNILIDPANGGVFLRLIYP